MPCSAVRTQLRRHHRSDLINHDVSALIYCILILQDLLDNEEEESKERKQVSTAGQVQSSRGEPEAVLKQVQGCSGEERRKCSGNPGAGSNMLEWRVQRAPGWRLATLRVFPALLNSPRTAQASRALMASLIFLSLWLEAAGSTDLWASAPPPSPPRRRFILRTLGQAESLTSCVCTARLPNHASSRPHHSLSRPITSFPELWKDDGRYPAQKC